MTASLYEARAYPGPMPAIDPIAAPDAGVEPVTDAGAIAATDAGSAPDRGEPPYVSPLSADERRDLHCIVSAALDTAAEWTLRDFFAALPHEPLQV